MKHPGNNQCHRILLIYAHAKNRLIADAPTGRLREGRQRLRTLGPYSSDMPTPTTKEGARKLQLVKIALAQ